MTTYRSQYVCQVNHHRVETLTCPARESGGYRCEKIGIHDHHWIGEHTREHARWGNGWPCEVVEATLDRQLALDIP